ncbi:ATP synthase F1 subunit epsilon [Agathobaculum sp. NTUH-O15-33]|uniref:ATP synthase F1 subunit epsilon n=1 Tax=Agathobaculum sp. NTUH-O15-33 TaxID=3079302 RepID=UPI0029583A99|nr:ATP synthase F1 subunit epsilon [Agathobaculum sp. NTUH-O15-33]WNX83597.1 ATP synthase F1 subunit epsilon [Agathobaculum sp. NTUH-O15-33]
MSTFHLKVLTTERQFYDGDVDRIVVRTTQGDVGILPNHVPYTAALGIGGLTVIANGSERIAAVSGGFVDVSKDGTVVLARTCEWADEIDINRAREAAERARAKLQQKESEHEQNVAQVKLKKAINRMRIAEEK